MGAHIGKMSSVRLTMDAISLGQSIKKSMVRTSVEAGDSLQERVIDTFGSTQDSLGGKGQDCGTCAVLTLCTTGRNALPKGRGGLVIPQASRPWDAQVLFKLESKIQGTTLNSC